MSLMLVSVKLNQMERASGQTATISISTIMGVRNSQAVRVLEFMVAYQCLRRICLRRDSSFLTASSPVVRLDMTSCAAL